jgi:hypothetical protein
MANTDGFFSLDWWSNCEIKVWKDPFPDLQGNEENKEIFHKHVTKNWALLHIENYGSCCEKIMIIGGLLVDNISDGCQTLQKE